MSKPKIASEFDRFKELARQVFAAPKPAVAKALAKEKASREKKRKAG